LVMWWDNGRCQHIGAHRFTLSESLGRPVRDGMYACHILECPFRNCVNPAHLYEGTPQQNCDDKAALGRQVSGDRHGARLRPESRSRGERNGKVVHSDEFVRHAVACVRFGATQTFVARALGVSRTTLRDWVAGRKRAGLSPNQQGEGAKEKSDG